jgi:hypothetical protein
VPSPSESAPRALSTALRFVALAVGVAACGGGATDVPPLPLTTLTRLDVQVDGDTVLLGDTVQAVARGVNRVGDVLALVGTRWSTSDSSVISVSDSGVLRARNVGSIQLAAASAGALGTRTIRVVSRAVRVTLQAPDSVELVDQIQLVSRVETTAGQPLVEVAPRFASTDTSIARVQPVGVGTAAVEAVRPGSTTLLAIIGRDTTRRRLVVRVTPLRELSVTIVPRVVAVGDSVPFTITARDSLGRSVPTRTVLIGIEPAGAMRVGTGHLTALTFGRVVVSVTNGTLISRDTLTAQGPSEFPLDIVDGDAQNPLPLRVRLSMERVAARWRSVIRSAPGGEFVRLTAGECRNAVGVAQFITGIRVLVKLDTLPPRIAGQGGPCVIRATGLPLLGTVSLNILSYGTLSDRKLDDLLQHEVGHVLGLGTIWGRGAFAPLIDGDSAAPDPIFVGPNALAAFSRLGQSSRFTRRTVPIQPNVRGHWRADAFLGELMAPTLINAAQPTSAVTVAALRDLGWNVEPEAYDDFTLPAAVLAPAVSARVVGSAHMSGAVHSLESDILLPELMLVAGRYVRLDPATGRPRRK